MQADVEESPDTNVSGVSVFDSVPGFSRAYTDHRQAYDIGRLRTMAQRICKRRQGRITKCLFQLRQSNRIDAGKIAELNLAVVCIYAETN